MSQPGQGRRGKRECFPSSGFLLLSCQKHERNFLRDGPEEKEGEQDVWKGGCQTGELLPVRNDIKEKPEQQRNWQSLHFTSAAWKERNTWLSAMKCRVFGGHFCFVRLLIEAKSKTTGTREGFGSTKRGARLPVKEFNLFLNAFLRALKKTQPRWDKPVRTEADS